MLSWIESNGKIILLAKTIRVFSYGFISIILPYYLKSLGYSATLVGIIVTIAVLSNAIFNIIVGKYGEIIGRNRTLRIFSMLMIISSILLLIPNIITITLAAIFGIISVTGTETGPFLSVEQSALTKFVRDEKRTLLFSIYNFLGYSAASLGALFPNVPFYFLPKSYSYESMIILYGFVGLILYFLYWKIGESIEINVERKNVRISDETKKKIIKLSLLFSMDAFGGGFILQSLLVLWFNYRFGLNIEAQTWIFFGAGIITALSFFLAERIARKIGLLNTMVFTHIPSNIFLLLIAFSTTPVMAIILLFLRQSLSQMDVPTRQSYTMAIVKPEERTATSAITNIPRSISQAGSPYLSSYAISIGSYSIPFILSGSIKIIYDILIFLTFRKIKPPEEK